MANAAPALDGVHLFLTDDVDTLYQVDARTNTVRHRMHLGGSIHNLGLVLAAPSAYPTPLAASSTPSLSAS